MFFYRTRLRLSAALYGAAAKCYAFADKVDPPEAVDFDLDAMLRDDITSAEAWLEIERSIREGAERARARYFDDLERRLVHGDSDVVWRDPAPRDIEGLKEVVREAYENGQPVEPKVMAQIPKVVVSDEKLLGPFEHHDLAPYLEQFDNMVRDIIRANADAKEQTMADWLDDVGTVVPGFDSDAARQIIAERDRFLP